MSIFDRYLSLWGALCIIASVVLSRLFPGVFQTVAGWEYASVNLIVALLIWAMVYPMMVTIDFASLRHVQKPLRISPSMPKRCNNEYSLPVCRQFRP